MVVGGSIRWQPLPHDGGGGCSRFSGQQATHITRTTERTNAHTDFMLANGSNHPHGAIGSDRTDTWSRWGSFLATHVITMASGRGETVLVDAVAGRAATLRQCSQRQLKKEKKNEKDGGFCVRYGVWMARQRR
ncbi:unnamed protein product [Lactuca saligna]|uniref:Uncharacterized protein n=1 Tax=Lactuca saligna TaxID=75948 RepID=A0AA36ED04_LACSI|nr:unnamed protein product [Lactuca saligna]